MQEVAHDPKYNRWLTRAGLVAFAFFFIKGLVWLGVIATLTLWGGSGQ